MVSNQEFGLILEALFSNKEFQGKHFAKRSRELFFWLFLQRVAVKLLSYEIVKQGGAEKEIRSNMSML